MVSICFALTSVAQNADPSTAQMIQQLKPPPPRTRGMRNLSVEKTSTPPSLSLLIQFEFNSAQISSQSQQALTNLSQALLSSELKGSNFAVEGHTDAKGSADYNHKLSEQRAQAVREFLISKGIVESRLIATGKGSSELANSEQPFAAENRRVRIVNLD